MAKFKVQLYWFIREYNYSLSLSLVKLHVQGQRLFSRINTTGINWQLDGYWHQSTFTRPLAQMLQSGHDKGDAWRLRISDPPLLCVCTAGLCSQPLCVGELSLPSHGLGRTRSAGGIPALECPHPSRSWPVPPGFSFCRFPSQPLSHTHMVP